MPLIAQHDSSYSGIHFDQQSTVVAWPPTFNFVERPYLDVFVETPRSEYVVKLILGCLRCLLI